MTCSACGNMLAQDARFCPHCGAPIATRQPQPSPIYAGVPVGLPYSRVARHFQIAGVLWIVYAFYRAISKLIALMVLHGIFGSHFNGNWGHSWDFGSFGIAALWPIIVASLVIGLVLSLLTGYALLTKQPWGRVIAIVTSVLALLHPITGTALGIYTLWVLAPSASGMEYAAITNGTPRP